MRVSWTQANAVPAASDIADRAPVRDGLTSSTMSLTPETMVAWKFPQAPSMVEVDVAASRATSVMPRDRIASLNSSAVICPSAMASRKLPVYAPASASACWILPLAPGIASANWLKFSVVSLPWPAVWVRTIPTDLNVSALPPATAFRFPAASARRS